jgi:N-acetylmuramoyl-L-alanine amidase
MKRSMITTFMMFLITGSGFAQPLDNTLICIDPGHGGHESDDRFIAETGFWESESNLEKAKYLRAILESFGATVILTREGNDGEIDDPSLSERDAIANENQVDYFNSIHSNGFNGTNNSTLMLFRGYDNEPVEPDAKLMGSIMAVEIYNAHRTTHWSNRGDWSFRPEWGTQGYGVLRYLDMPGTISEGSFHDYIPESWRLMNSDYRKHEAWAIARSFMEFYDAGTFSFAGKSDLSWG